ncbi:MAG: hypothetical protein KME42_14190 [Tildeniella nuda ZEHNDER 1965/U140]|nr:hypothetical protein [Tildeniella nuda ZEHNDER 1965/U140]
MTRYRELTLSESVGGQAIREMRQRLGMAQEHLAKDIDIDLSQLEIIESGNLHPNRRMINAINSAFVERAYFINY